MVKQLIIEVLGGKFSHYCYIVNISYTIVIISLYYHLYIFNFIYWQKCMFYFEKSVLCHSDIQDCLLNIFLGCIWLFSFFCRMQNKSQKRSSTQSKIEGTDLTWDSRRPPKQWKESLQYFLAGLLSPTVLTVEMCDAHVFCLWREFSNYSSVKKKKKKVWAKDQNQSGHHR